MFLAMQMHPYMKPHQKKRTPQAWIQFPWEQAAATTKEDREVSAEESAQLRNLVEDYKRRK